MSVSTPTQFGTDCKLMLHMDGINGSTTFIDSSLSAKTVSANGSAKISTAQSKFGGASGLLNGSTDFLSVPSSTDWNPSTNIFTIDFQCWFTSLPSNGTLSTFISRMGASGNYSWNFFIYNNSGTYVVYWQTSSDGTAITNYGPITWSTPSTGQFYHIALTSDGTNLRFFVDGTQQGSNVSISGQTYYSSTNKLKIGCYGADGGETAFLSAYIDELRFVNETAVWTANFTSPSNAYIPIIPGAQFFSFFR